MARYDLFGLGPVEMAIVGVIAVLLFGKRLPEVGQSLGKGIVEFKQGDAYLPRRSPQELQDDLRFVLSLLGMFFGLLAALLFFRLLARV